MPPIRRYLRITRYSVLEVRIYLDDPAQAVWLLHGANPALPRIIAEIRPLVLPKLREENERSRSKSIAKKGGVKDVVNGDDFEVSIFLTDSPSRHSILTKSKTFLDPKRPKGLRDWLEPKEGSAPAAITIEDDDVSILGESSEEEINLSNIPRLGEDKPSQDDNKVVSDTDANDDKKLAPRTTYDGFSIYGRVLCLVVKRKGPSMLLSSSKTASSQQMIESWVSTQVAIQADLDDEGADAVG